MLLIDDDTTAAEPAVAARRYVAVAVMLGLVLLVLAVPAWHLHGGLVGDGVAAKFGATTGSSWWTLATDWSQIGSGGAVAAIAVVIGAFELWRRRLRAAVVVVGAPAIAGVAEVALKALIGRTRPASAVLAGESGNGFPSGHVSGFAALVVAVVVLLVLERSVPTRRRTLAVLAAVLAIAAMAVSRVVLGVHYASDTLAGACLGAGIALALAATVTSSRVDAVMRSVGRRVDRPRRTS